MVHASAVAFLPKHSEGLQSVPQPGNDLALHLQLRGPNHELCNATVHSVCPYMRRQARTSRRRAARYAHELKSCQILESASGITRVLKSRQQQANKKNTAKAHTLTWDFSHRWTFLLARNIKLANQLAEQRGRWIGIL